MAKQGINRRSCASRIVEAGHRG